MRRKLLAGFAALALAIAIHGSSPLLATGVSTGSTAPSGAAGGSLSGTYPNPRLSVGQLVNTLSGDVAISGAGAYTDGPSVAQGTTGIWDVTGQVTVTDTVAGTTIDCKLWDGGVLIVASGRAQQSGSANTVTTLALSGIVTTPAGNMRISCKSTTANSVIKFNATGNSADSTLKAWRMN